MKTMLLASAAALALTAGAASAGHYVPPTVIHSTHSGKAFHVTPRAGSTILYDQTASSGFSSYAVASTQLLTSGYSGYDSIGADDFVIPGTTKHKITAVYAPGVNLYGYGYGATSMNVIFFNKLKFSKKGLAEKVKAVCSAMPSTDLSGSGFMEVFVSSCSTGKFKGGHDYSVSVQTITPSGQYFQHWWYWQTNRNQVGRQGLWTNYGGAFGLCTSGFTPMKTCFPTTGIGPDLAFGIIGN